MTPDELTRLFRANPDLAAANVDDPFDDINRDLFGPPATETRPAPISEEDAQLDIVKKATRWQDGIAP